MGGIDAMALSASDWSLGVEFVRGLVQKHRLPVLAANLSCEGGDAFPPSRTVDVSGRRIGIVAVTEGEVPGCTVGDAAPAIRAAAEALTDTDFTVALVPAIDQRGVGRVLSVGQDDLGVDLVIDANSRSMQARPQQRGGSWWTSAGNRGRHLGVATLSFLGESDQWTVAAGGLGDPERDLERARKRRDDAARLASEATSETHRARYLAQREAYDRKIAALEAQVEGGANRIEIEVVPLDRSVSDHEATAELVAAGKDRITATVQTAPTAFVARKVAEGPYAGGEVCAECHAGPHAQWSTTGHARAWAGLVAENRAFDDACWSCHVTGAHAEGGPATARETGPFRDVQCESCHGPARAHAERPDDASVLPVRDPGEASCRTCHDGKQDGGRFDYASYLPKVSHAEAR